MPRYQQQQEMLGSSLKLLAVGVVAVAGVGAAWAYWGHHFWTAMKGPTEVALADIAKMEDPRKLPSTWVKVKLENAVKSTVALEETGHGSSHIAEVYFMFQAGDRWMIANVPPTWKGPEIEGQIWHNNSPLSREAIAAVTDELKDVHKGKVFPYEFDAGKDYGTNWKCFAGVMAFFGGTGALLGFTGLGGLIRYVRQPRLEDDGLSPGDDFSNLDSQTAAAANEAMARFLRDAGR